MAYFGGPKQQLTRLQLTSLNAVTGADGFIGSHLVEALVKSGENVRAMVQYNALGTRGWLDAIDPHALGEVEVVAGDIRDAALTLAFLRGVDTAYHLAALIAIPYSYEAPASYVATNTVGTLNILEAARNLGTNRLIHTSTSEVYGSAQIVPIDETHPLQAQSPYAASKIAADKLAESFHLSFGLPVVTLRPFNTFGPRQSTRAVIPTIITQVVAGAEELHLGSATPTRDFTFVEDTAAAFIAVGQATASEVVGGVLNAGSGSEISVGDLAAKIASMIGRSATIVEDPLRKRPVKSEVHRLICDSGRLRALTGWTPRHSLEEGLQTTIAWFTEPANLARYRVHEYQR